MDLERAGVDIEDEICMNVHTFLRSKGTHSRDPYKMCVSLLQRGPLLLSRPGGKTWSGMASSIQSCMKIENAKNEPDLKRREDTRSWHGF